MKPNRQSFRIVVGSWLRHWREQRGERQEIVALAARREGLTWYPNTVAQVESGRRHLTVEEWLLLPRVLSKIGGPKTWAGLIPESGIEQVMVTPQTWMPLDVLQNLVRDNGEIKKGLDEDKISTPHSRHMQAFRKENSSHGRKRRADTIATGGFTDSSVMEVMEVDRKAARKLRTTPQAITAAAQRLWGRSLLEERERVFALKGLAPIPPRRAQAIRAVVTRMLLQQLMTKGQVRQDKSKGGRQA